MKLNLGCGRRKLAGWVNVDSQPTEEPDVLLDLSVTAWPWPSDSVDAVLASHVLEHIAPGEPFFHVMKETWRVCKDGAKVEIILPHPSHDIYLNDPTHLQAVMPGTLAMFSRQYVESQAAKQVFLTPFYKRLGIDFDFGKVGYWFADGVDVADPELEWKAKHLRNIIAEWGITLTAVK